MTRRIHEHDRDNLLAGTRECPRCGLRQPAPPDEVTICRDCRFEIEPLPKLRVKRY